VLVPTYVSTSSVGGWFIRSGVGVCEHGYQLSAGCGSRRCVGRCAVRHSNNSPPCLSLCTSLCLSVCLSVSPAQLTFSNYLLYKTSFRLIPHSLHCSHSHIATRCVVNSSVKTLSEILNTSRRARNRCSLRIFTSRK